MHTAVEETSTRPININNLALVRNREVRRKELRSDPKREPVVNTCSSITDLVRKQRRALCIGILREARQMIDLRGARTEGDAQLPTPRGLSGKPGTSRVRKEAGIDRRMRHVPRGGGGKAEL